MPAVPSAYQPSGALPAGAVPFLLLGSVLGCVVGFCAETVVGSAGLALVGQFLKADPREVMSWYYPWPVLYVVMLIATYLFTIFGAYFVTGWVSAWCTTRFGEWGKNRNLLVPALLSFIASIIPVIVACACYFDSELCTGRKSPLEKAAAETTPLLSLWLFSHPFAAVSAAFGFVIAPAAAIYFTVQRVLAVKFCEHCKSFMRASGRKELTLGCLRVLARAVRKERLDVAASLLHSPSWGDGEARLYCCRHCSRGYLEVTVTYAAHWPAAHLPSYSRPTEPTEKKEAWLAVSCELAAPDTERLRQAFRGITDSP
ncbi:MAG TPA: hypothetical protein VMS17_24690 [Gemmataceae bacterium]|nr:hypothetical protein [Gemmataceae bacterium]